MVTEVALVKLSPNSGRAPTPTSTHFLRSEAVASQVRGLAPASDGNIATDSDTNTAQTNPGSSTSPEGARTAHRGHAHHHWDSTSPRNSNVSSHWLASEPLALIS